ncbi:MAG: hypothetical protein ACLQIB_09425 [Isosphaeraceae bacterium]
MHFGTMIFALGVLTSLIGILVEAVAMAGVASYRVRKALPVSSPIPLQVFGCYCFCAGVMCAAFGAWLVR